MSSSEAAHLFITTIIRSFVLYSFIASACSVALLAQIAPDTAASGTLSITGDVQSPISITMADLDKMPQETITVSDEDGTRITYGGVPLREILLKAGAPLGKQLRGKALASYIVAKAHDGYQVVFTLAELDPAFANESILVADKRDGKPLFGYQGPLRLVCRDDKAGARSVRMLETIELVKLRK